jgi:hypothetical protein
VPTIQDTDVQSFATFAKDANGNLICSTVPADQSTSQVKQLTGFAKDVGGILSAALADNPSKADVAKNVLTFLSDTFFGSTQDESTTVDQIKQELDCAVVGLDWKVTQLSWVNDEYVPVEAAWMDISRGIMSLDPDDNASHRGTMSAGAQVMFERAFLPSATDGNGVWKTIITNSAPTRVDPGQVFDWRMGFPRFMSLIAKRLMIIAAIDANFASRPDLWSPELEGTQHDPGYRVLLQQRLQTMLDGVKCAYHDLDPTSSDSKGEESTDYQSTEMACADINTGLNVITRYTRQDALSCAPNYERDCMAALPSQADIDNQLALSRAQILKQICGSTRGKMGAAIRS